ncbi:MAG: M17 family metallopeptidase [Betaproteobacteria bacterium]
MLAKLSCRSGLPNPDQLAKRCHVLIVLPAGREVPDDCPDHNLLLAVLKRRNKKPGSLKTTPVVAGNADGGLRVWCMLDMAQSPFEQQTLLRKAVQPLLEEQPAGVDVLIVGDRSFADIAGTLAAYVVLANGTPLPAQKKTVAKPLKTVTLWGAQVDERARVLAQASLLTRTLTASPPNSLTPGAYRERLAGLAGEHGWEIEEFGVERLRELGAGAFLAVAQGSAVGDAAIVRLGVGPKNAGKRVAIIGKGICFDTGGHNLKSAKYMAGMHEDMAGSAVALGILFTASRLELPLRIDIWLALARNEISPQAYRQGDVVTAVNGTTIEIVHTDAEGRLVLADALALAARDKPDLMIDFATLTGSMVYALGTRYAGLFATQPALAELAVTAGRTSGERVCVFPMDEDYEADLDSDVADIKQCTLEGEADHILAARFLKRFVGKTPWLHMDLSTASCKGGLGAIGTDQTGFGVAWGIDFLGRWLEGGEDSH